MLGSIPILRPLRNFYFEQPGDESGEFTLPALLGAVSSATQRHRVTTIRNEHSLFYLVRRIVSLRFVWDCAIQAR